MIQDSHRVRFSHEFKHTSNKERLALLVILFCAFVACSPVSSNSGNPGTTSTKEGSNSPQETALSTATATNVPTRSSANASPVPSDTPAGRLTLTPSPLSYLAPPPAGQSVAVPILMYHHLESLDPSSSLILRTWTVSPIGFREQLDYLAAHGFHTINFVQLDAFFEKRMPLPIHPVILTFDDGWRDDYVVAFPALRERGMVGTFFVPTAYAGAPGGTLLSWAQIEEMDAAGMEFGGHTISHANLMQVSKEEALRQLQSSKSRMEEKLGHSTVAFAYPFGAYNAEVVGLVREVGYREGVGLCCGYKLSAEILLTLPRIRISYDDALPDFVKKLPPDSP